jgi:hypothetical protein
MPPLKIITADERMAMPRSVKGLIVGPHGIGKTSLLWTMDPKTTLLIDMEAGDLCLQGWPGESIKVRDWESARNLACIIGGPNPSKRSDQIYSQNHYQYLQNGNAELVAVLTNYATIFVDSISVAGRLCWQWSTGQPDAFSEKTGKRDNRGAYGLLGRELVEWFTQLQHIAGRSVWLVGGLDEKKDDFGRTFWAIQIDGSKASLEIPGIFDEVISMVQLETDANESYRAFVCQTVNQWRYPAKDRSGRLSTIEEPHLGKLMDKIAGPVRPVSERLTYAMPLTNNANSEE